MRADDRVLVLGSMELGDQNTPALLPAAGSFGIGTPRLVHAWKKFSTFLN